MTRNTELGTGRMKLSQKSQKFTLFQLLINLRISNAIVPTALVLLGLFWNDMAGFDLGYVFLIFGTFFGNVFGFVINDFYDTAADLDDPKKKIRNVFCRLETRRNGFQALSISISLSMIFGALASLNSFIIIGLLNLFLFLYSAPPVRLRDRAVFDWVFVVIWKGLIILASYVYLFGWVLIDRGIFVYGTLVLILLITLIGQIGVNQLTDFEIDLKTNKSNTVQTLGRYRSLYLVRFLLVLLFVTGLYISIFYRLYFTLSLILGNILLFYVIPPNKRQYALDVALIWIITTYVEYYLTSFNIYVLILFGTWVIAMFGFAILHAKRLGLI